MVRILKINGSRDKKKELLARSEIYRQTLMLEVTNVKLAGALLKKRLRFLKTIYRLVGMAAPISGMLFGHKQQEEKKKSFLSRFLAGFSIANSIKSLFSSDKTAEQPAEDAEDSGRF